MSELDAKLSSPQGTGGRARASYAQLRARTDTVRNEQFEDLFLLVSMGKRETWRRVAGRGESSLFELEEVR